MKKEFNPFQVMIDNAEGLTLTISPGNLRSSLAILYIKNKCEGNVSSKSILKSNCHLLRQAVILVRGLDIWVWEIISQVFHGILLSLLSNIQ